MNLLFNHRTVYEIMVTKGWVQIYNKSIRYEDSNKVYKYQVLDINHHLGLLFKLLYDGRTY